MSDARREARAPERSGGGVRRGEAPRLSKES